MKRVTASIFTCLLLAIMYGCDNPSSPTDEGPTDGLDCSWQTPPHLLQGTVSYITASNAYGADTLWNQTLEISWIDTSIYDDLGLLIDGWSGVGTRTVQAPGNPNATYQMHCEAVAWTSPYYEYYMYIQIVDDSLLTVSVSDSLVSQGITSVACDGETGLAGSFVGVRAEREMCWGAVRINGTD